MLFKGDLDAAFFVISATSKVVNELLRSEDVELFSFERAAAYTRHYRFLSPVRLPEGAIDFRENIPARDIILLAAATNLVARRARLKGWNSKKRRGVDPPFHFLHVSLWRR